MLLEDAMPAICAACSASDDLPESPLGLDQAGVYLTP